MVSAEAHTAQAKVTHITSTAGVSTGSFYTYFASKDEIFREIAREVVDELVVAAHRDPDEPHEDLAASIEAALRRYVAVAARHATLTSSLQRISHVDPELRAYRTEGMARTVARTERTIRSLQEAGIVAPSVDAATLAQVLQSMVISAVYDRLTSTDGELDQDELVATLTHVWVRALGLAR
jgi:AcrR family transcriptional regulator